MVLQIRGPHAVLYTLLFGLYRVDFLGPKFFSRVAMLAATHARSMGSFALV